MLSALSRGYSSWNGELDIYGEAIETKNLPEVGPAVEYDRHKHGVTVTPRASGRGYPYPSHHQPQSPIAAAPKEDGQLELPKTFLTRKGALLLFSAPDAPPEKDHVRPKFKAVARKRKQQELINLSLKLGTLERLSLSVLQYGDQGFDRENSSVSDKNNRLFLKFLHQLTPPETVSEEKEEEAETENPLTDSHVQPGADLDVYLKDLKRRASSRQYGREGSLSSRARSMELRDILQQLEDAWPSGQPLPKSQAPTSYFSDGSFLTTEEFFYSRSPSPCSESSRAFSGRNRVLSSQKLTASLKSLNCLGRPASTEPGESTRSVTSPDLVIPPYGHFQTPRPNITKSGYWSGAGDAGDLRKRPASQQEHRRSASAERQRTASTDGRAPLEEAVPPIEEEGADTASSSTGSRAISVQVSSPMGYPVDGSTRLTMDSVPEVAGEIDRTSVSSSLQQEDDIILPSDGEEEGPGKQEDKWPGAGDRASKEGLAQPLQPQYSGVLRDSEMHQDSDEDKLRKSEQASRPGSRTSSVASMRSKDVYRPSSVMSSRGASRAGMVPEEEAVDQEGLDELMATDAVQQDETSAQQQLDAFLLDQVTRQLERSDKYAASVSGSVDPQEQDPETLVSLQGGATAKSSSSVKSGSDGPENLQRTLATPEPRAAAASPVSDQKAASAASPEPQSLSSLPPVVVPISEEMVPDGPEAEVEEVEVDGKEPSVAAETEAVKDSASVRTEGVEEDSKSSVDPDYMAMAEAGFRVMPSPLPPSRSASPAPSVTQPAPEQTPPVEPEPAKEVAQKEAVPEKLPDIKKPEQKSPHPPTSKKPPTPRIKSPTKAGKMDKKAASGKNFVKAMDISSVQPDQAEAEVAKEPPKPKESPRKKEKKESYRPPPPPPRPKVQAEKPGLNIPEHMQEAMQRNANQAEYELENELMKMHKAMNDSLGLPLLVTDESEGLTEEELQQAQQAMQPKQKAKKELEEQVEIMRQEEELKLERLDEAKRKMQEALTSEGEKKPPTTPRKQSEAKAKKNKKVRMVDPKVAEDNAAKEAAKEQRRLERQKRLEDAKALQEMISQKEKERKDKEVSASQKAKELEEQVEIMRQEEESIQQAEEDAREQLQAMRKVAREEREARRKADLEKKKQEAMAKREKERHMMEEARKKEQEMLDRIADAEMRRTMREEEERRRDEEERLAQERYEKQKQEEERRRQEELYEAQLQAEEEERRLQELERQAEEEAFQRIIAEREEAERQREELEIQARRMAEEEERQRQAMLEEEQRLEEERLRQEQEEEKRMEEERQRLKELQRMEEEMREKMRAEIEQRREWALKRREVNLDRRKNLDGLRQTQGVTEPWQFSYFVHWPRETYSRPMGESQQQQKGKKPPKKK